MAYIDKSNVTNGNTIQATDITNIVDALDSTSATAIKILGEFAQGTGTIPAAGTKAFAQGRSTIATGSFSHAEGFNAEASGEYSHAEGFDSISSGTYSHAEGNTTQAIGEGSHAEGTNSIASGSYSHAEGTNTQALGDYSHAEGELTQAVGNYSHAEGSNTQAIGTYSHAEGDATIAIGGFSYTGGRSTIASGSYQFVIGQLNTEGDDTSLFIVGGGLEEVRKDAFKVTHSSSIQIPQTQSAAPSWTGVDGEIIPATVSGTHYLYMWMNGAWRSSSFA